ncbi:hypothetical protein A2U01_0038314, partial [Trifolium medium]|nr:hypothetical protein [Trifolium medium]
MQGQTVGGSERRWVRDERRLLPMVKKRKGKELNVDVVSLNAVIARKRVGFRSKIVNLRKRRPRVHR